VKLHPVVGHQDVQQVLAGAHARDSLPSTLLLHGPKGVGKQRVALWLAQLLVCEVPSLDGPCESCPSCRMALGVEHPDLHWYFPIVRPKGVSGDRLVGALEDARMKALVERRAEPLRASYDDELRGLYLGVVKNIRKRAHLRPTMAEGQIFIIGDAELLVPQESSPEAANALLKLLEEPPGASRFILTSCEPGRLLATIRSRSVPLHLAPPTIDEVEEFLMSSASAEPDEAAWAARLSQGAIGRALGFLPDGSDKGPLEALRRKAYVLVDTALTKSPAAGYSTALSYSPAGARKLMDLFAFVEEWLRDFGAVAAGAGDAVFNHDARPRLEEIVNRSGIAASDLTLAISAVEEARVLARGNVNPQLVISGLIRNIQRRVVRQQVAR
jgi:DNA polymerase-3 subunit delta'